MEVQATFWFWCKSLLHITQVTTTGSDALTLANGANGQIKIITMVADGGDATLTPTTFGGSTITFNDVGDSVLLVYNTTGGWAVVSNTGCSILIRSSQWLLIHWYKLKFASDSVTTAKISMVQ